MLFLRKDTVTTIIVGPFIDKTDGVTPEIALTVTNIDVELYLENMSRIAFQPTLSGGGTHDMWRHSGDIGGWYKLELEAADVAQLGKLMVSFEDVAVFLPVYMSYMVLPQNVYDQFVLQDGTVLTELSNVSSKLGAFTSGTNTIFDWMKASLRKDAALPSQIGGTFAVATDSQEALAEKLTAMAGTGFSASSDSLEAISNAIDTSVTITVAGSGSLTFRSTGFLNRVVKNIRQATDEPDVNAKYTDQIILDMLTPVWQELFSDLNLQEDQPLILEYDVTLVTGTRYYTLPPTVGVVNRFGRINTTTGLVDEEIIPRALLNPAGPGWTLKGLNLDMGPKDVGSGEVLRVFFEPSGAIYPHEAVGGVVGDDTDKKTYQFNVSGLVGTMDLRDNAYGGYLLRVWDSAGVVEERYIASSTLTGTTVSAVLDQAFTITLAGTSYEVVPSIYFFPMVENLIALRTARKILSNEGAQKRWQMVTQEYREVMRQVRITLGRREEREGSRFQHDSVDNVRYARTPQYVR